MVEPFLYPIMATPGGNIYYEKTPTEFKNPRISMSLIPMNSRIIAGDRQFFTKDEIEADPILLRSAYENTIKNKLRISDKDKFISVRAAKNNDKEIPCAACFMITTVNEKLFKTLNIDIDDFYIIFITPDEVLFAPQKLKITEVRKEIQNIKNKMSSIFNDDAPILTTRIFIYDKERMMYFEA